MTVSIRPGLLDDLEQVMNVMGRAFDPAFGEAWNRAQCLGILALPDVMLSVAIDDEDGMTVGFALCRMLVDDGELLLLAVDPAHRSCGIGRALIEYAASWAAERGAARLLLEMRDGNAAAALYETCGFGRIGRRPQYYRGSDGAPFDALTLALPLR
jgi:ribosomal-protein-alanine N-acetyltransferase